MLKRNGSYLLIFSLIAVIVASLLTGFGQLQAAGVEASRSCLVTNGVVASAHPLASQAGLEVLKKGGNAVDAAIATSFALGAVEPFASGIGGGGMAIVYMAKENKTYIVDFQDSGPGKVRKDTYKPVNGKVPEFKKIGYKSVAIPGELRGMEMLHDKFGTVKWADLIAPAIHYADEGITVSKTLSAIIAEDMARIDKYPAGSKEWFMKQFYVDGLPLQPGDKYINKELSVTLKKIAESGPDAFYKGEIAESIVDEFAKADGWISREDLANYRAVLRQPLKGTYRGYEIYSFPPPGSGLVVLEMLNILEGFEPAGVSADQFKHYFIEAQKLAFADRAKHAGDTDYVSVPLKGLLNKKYATEQRNLIDPQKASKGSRKSEIDPWQYENESGSTTSFAVIDKEGNMVSITKTLGHFMGAGVVVGGTGIIMNDHMDTFYANPASRNAPEPGKRVFSAISSTLVLKDGKPILAVGSPGASRINSTVAEIVVNVVDYQMELQQAINAPRIHNRNSKKTQIEGSTPLEIRQKLEARGHVLEVMKNLDLFFGGAQGVMRRPDGKLQGAADPRRDGIAVGF